MDKKQARAYALAQRKKENKEEASRRVLDAILSFKTIEEYQCIGLYYPIGDEIDLMPLVEKYPEKRFYLPITRKEISFVEYKALDPLVSGPFHTMEPVGEVIDRNQIECFLIPCVGVTKDQRRIGYGKGFYDRYLEGYTGVRIGIVYKSGCMDVLGDSFDIVLNQIIKG